MDSATCPTAPCWWPVVAAVTPSRTAARTSVTGPATASSRSRCADRRPEGPPRGLPPGRRGPSPRRAVAQVRASYVRHGLRATPLRKERTSGRYRIVRTTCDRTPARSTAAATRSASASVVATGFSRSDDVRRPPPARPGPPGCQAGPRRPRRRTAGAASSNEPTASTRTGLRAPPPPRADAPTPHSAPARKHRQASAHGTWSPTVLHRRARLWSSPAHASRPSEPAASGPAVVGEAVVDVVPTQRGEGSGPGSLTTAGWSFV